MPILAAEVAGKGEVYRAGPPVLGARLLTAANMVPAGATVADIGCDHGKLAVWLALKGGVAKVIAVDNRPMPLQRAKALVEQTGTAALVSCRLGDGLAPVAPKEATVIVVAGMSGETIARILERCQWVKSTDIQLVLVPATRHGHLRQWLCENGFAIGKETAVEEKGRVYTVLSACYTGQITHPDELFCQLGLVAEGGGPAARAYIEKRLAHLEKQGRAAMNEVQRRQHQQLKQEIEGCLK